MVAESQEDPAVLQDISRCVSSGKTDAMTDIPAGSKGQPGVVELVTGALAAGHPAQSILERGLLGGMQVVGRKFVANEVFIPEVLIAARAMKAGMELLRPHFAEAEMPTRGTFVVGTVKGDLHDIGKNILGMVLEGAGWRVVDLGIDCPAGKFVAAVEEHPGCVVGLSALLTTTMMSMREIVAAVRQKRSEAVILIGGAPVTAAFAEQIGASGYAANPPEAVELLDRLAPRG